MNIGTIAYTTNSGLGILVKSFFDHGIITRILSIRHPRYDNTRIRYPEGSVFSAYSTKEVDRFLDGLDILLVLENTFGHWSTVKWALAKGTKFVLIPMYEYTPFPLPDQIPDPGLILCPSLLDLDCYRKLYPDVPSVFVPVPVDTGKFPWRMREEATTFVHNAGHGGKDFRNGTDLVLEAIRLVKSPASFVIRGQPDSGKVSSLLSKARKDFRKDPRVSFQLQELPDPADLYHQGEVFLFPERFNGLSLPLQEAYASGMVAMCGARYPMHTWLPREPMIPIASYSTKKVQDIEFQCANYTPEDIARTVDTWYGKDVRNYSVAGRNWGRNNSWDMLRSHYVQLFSDVLCEVSPASSYSYLHSCSSS